MTFPSKCPNNGQKGGKGDHFRCYFQCFWPPFPELRKPRFDCAGAVGLHVRPSGMTTFFDVFLVHFSISSPALLRDHFFMDFLVFGTKMMPQRGPRGWPTNHVFHHFNHLGAQMPPQASTMAPGGGKVTKMVPKVSKIPPKSTPKHQKVKANMR